jgi:protein-disulfide isomerase
MASRHARLVLPIPGRDHVLGPPDAPAILVEYGDYECPHCGRAYPIVEAVRRRLGRRLQFAYRHFPLAEIHLHARRAAEAAEAAGAQEHFWDMHDRLFEHQHELADDELRGHAAALGLDAERFDRELREGVHRERVEEDLRSGTQSGIPSTPGFFVNGTLHTGSPTEPDLRRVIEMEFG